MLSLQARMQLPPLVELQVLRLLWSAKGQPLPKMVVLVEPGGLT